MELIVGERGVLELEEVFNPIKLISTDREELSICMRDGGFEFVYEGKTFRAVGGIVEEIDVTAKGSSDDGINTKPKENFPN